MLLQMARFHSFLIANIPLYINHIFFIHSSVGGYLGSLHNLAVDSASINIGVHVPLGSAFLYLLYKYLVVQLLGFTVVSFLVF